MREEEDILLEAHHVIILLHARVITKVVINVRSEQIRDSGSHSMLQLQSAAWDAVLYLKDTNL